MTPEAGRVLGCLAEKQLTTPQQYPLSLNALTLACSQSTNREPVMAMDDPSTQQALAELKELRLVRFVLPSHGKSVIRFRHVLDEMFGLDAARVALVAVLLLRGPQTVGELRTRTGRMAEFDSLDAVYAELTVLAGQPEPLVLLLPRQPGQKEERWQQLLAAQPARAAVSGGGVGSAGPDAIGWAQEVDDPPPGPEAKRDGDRPGRPATVRSAGASDLEQRLEALASDVAGLRDELDAIRASLGALRESLGD